MTLATDVTLDIYLGDNLAVMKDFPDGSFDLIYMDPPFNTGKTQARSQLKTVQDPSGDRVGFKGQRYKTVQVGLRAFADHFDDFLGFLEPRLEEARRLLGKGDFDLALERSRQALATDPESAEAYELLATIYDALGDKPGAAEARAKAKSLGR